MPARERKPRGKRGFVSVDYLTLSKDNGAYRRDKISEIVTWVVLRDGHVGRSPRLSRGSFSEMVTWVVLRDGHVSCEANRDNIVCECVRAGVPLCLWIRE